MSDFLKDEYGHFKRVFKKYMFIKKNGIAIHLLGNVSRNVYDAELIYVYNETDDYWIGQYAEGFGLFDVKFYKKDCRLATNYEVKLCEKGLMETIKF